MSERDSTASRSGAQRSPGPKSRRTEGGWLGRSPAICALNEVRDRNPGEPSARQSTPISTSSSAQRSPGPKSRRTGRHEGAERTTGPKRSTKSGTEIPENRPGTRQERGRRLGRSTKSGTEIPENPGEGRRQPVGSSGPLNEVRDRNPGEPDAWARKFLYDIIHAQRSPGPKSRRTGTDAEIAMLRVGHRSTKSGTEIPENQLPAGAGRNAPALRSTKSGTEIPENRDGRR